MRCKRTTASTAKRTKRTEAYTLIEVLMAFGMLAFIAFALFAAFSFGFKTIKVSQEDVRADQILVQKLETLRVYHWSKIFTNGYLPTSFSDYSTNSGIGQGVTYTGAIAVSSFPANGESYSNSLRQVTVTLGWVSGGVPRQRSMSTFVSQYGIQTYRY